MCISVVYSSRSCTGTTSYFQTTKGDSVLRWARVPVYRCRTGKYTNETTPRRTTLCGSITFRFDNGRLYILSNLHVSHSETENISVLSVCPELNSPCSWQFVHATHCCVRVRVSIVRCVTGLNSFCQALAPTTTFDQLFQIRSLIFAITKEKEYNRPEQVTAANIQEAFIKVCLSILWAFEYAPTRHLCVRAIPDSDCFVMYCDMYLIVYFLSHTWVNLVQINGPFAYMWIYF